MNLKYKLMRIWKINYLAMKVSFFIEENNNIIHIWLKSFVKFLERKKNLVNSFIDSEYDNEHSILWSAVLYFTLFEFTFEYHQSLVSLSANRMIESVTHFYFFHRDRRILFDKRNWPISTFVVLESLEYFRSWRGP